MLPMEITQEISDPPNISLERQNGEQTPTTTVESSLDLSVNSETTSTDKKRWRYVIAKTIVLAMVWASNGCYTAITTATVPDLRLRVNSNTEELGRAMAAFGFGVIVAAPLGGAMSDRWVWGRDIQIVSFMVLAALTIVVRPWVSQLWLLGTLIGLEGFFRGIYTPGKNNMMDRMWGDKIGFPRHLMSVSYVIGELLSTVVCRAFFLPKPPDDNNIHNNCSVIKNASIPYDNFTDGANVINASILDVSTQDCNSSSQGTNQTIHNASMFNNSHGIHSSPIEYPYLILTLWTFIPIIGMTVFYYFDRTSAEKYYLPLVTRQGAPRTYTLPSWKDIFSPKHCGQGSTAFGTVIISLLVMYYFILAFAAAPLKHFILAYAVDKLAFTKAHAATMVIITLALGVIMGTIWGALSHRFPIQILLFIQVFGEAIVVIIFNFVEINTATELYIFLCLFSVFHTPHWSTGITWGLRYIEFSALIYTVIEASASAGGMVATWATGYVLQYGNKEAILRLQLGANLTFCLVIIIMQVIGSRKGEKYTNVGSLALTRNSDIGASVSPLLEDQD